MRRCRRQSPLLLVLVVCLVCLIRYMSPDDGDAYSLAYRDANAEVRPSRAADDVECPLQSPGWLAHEACDAPNVISCGTRYLVDDGPVSPDKSGCALLWIEISSIPSADGVLTVGAASLLISEQIKAASPAKCWHVATSHRPAQKAIETALPMIFKILPDVDLSVVDFGHCAYGNTGRQVIF